MAWLTNLFSAFTLNPGLAAAGIGLIAAPIVIHLINRMRYRTVRFAAMEFLLASQRKNRRRVLLEQLLLLLLRVLIVAGLVFLLARLVLDPSALSLLRAGGATHHVMLLDDSGSMRNRVGAESAFDAAKEVVRQFVREVANEGSRQQLTVMLLSQARENEAIVSQRDIDQTLVNDLETRLGNLSATYQQLPIQAGLEAGRERLGAEGTGERVLHVISDFRQADWLDQPGHLTELRDLSERNVAVNLVRVVGEETPNLAVTSLGGDFGAVAAGVPVRVRVGVSNFGEQVSGETSLAIHQNQQALPLSRQFASIEPGEEAFADFDIAFPTPGRHALRFSINDDSLPADNQRFVAVDVAASLPLLIIDGTPGQGDGPALLADALAPAPGLSGLAPRIEPVDFLRREPLDGYRAIFLVNVPSLPRDIARALEGFAGRGGGIAWFLGDSVQPTAYNALWHGEESVEAAESPETPAGSEEPGVVARREAIPLFPVPLAETRVDRAEEATGDALDITFEGVGRFAPFAEELAKYWRGSHVNAFLPPAAAWERNDDERGDGVRTVARLSEGEPIVLRHDFGNGRVVTVLTSAGQSWTNWPRQFIYVPFLLEMFKELAIPTGGGESEVVGSALSWRLPASEFDPAVRIERPDGGSDSVRLVPGSEEEGGLTLSGTYSRTDQPGIYRVMTARLAGGTLDESWHALNVPLSESRLQLADSGELSEAFSGAENVSIRNPGEMGWLRVEEAGHEVRLWLIVLLILLLVAEQALAYRLSYHTNAELGMGRAARPAMETAR